MAVLEVVNTSDCGSLGIMFGSHPNSCSSSPSVYSQQNRIANIAGIALPLAILLLLPGWYKLLVIPAIVIGVPGINFKDSTPVFRPIFYGGL